MLSNNFTVTSGVHASNNFPVPLSRRIGHSGNRRLTQGLPFVGFSKMLDLLSFCIAIVKMTTKGSHETTA